MIWIVIGILLLLGAVAVALGFYINASAIDGESAYFGIGCVASVMFLAGMLCIACGTDNTPTALDVYRGKTTLEITYRDSVAIDSTVVYKVR